MAALVVASVAVYFNSIFGGFVCDDLPHILRNENIRSLANLPQFFTRGSWAMSDIQLTDTYKPFFLLIHALHYYVWGYNPVGYHLTNLVLHSLNGVLVFLIARRVLGAGAGVLAPFAGALLFALHPLMTESVSWITGITDVSAGFFVLGSFLAYLRYGQSGRTAFMWLSVVLFAFSVLSKESAILYPAAVAAYDWISHRKIYLKRLVALGSVSVLFFIAMNLVLGRGGHLGTMSVSFESLGWMLQFVAGYVKMLFVPWPPFFYLSVPDDGIISAPGAVFSAVAALGMAAWAYRDRASRFGLAWMILLLLPPLLLALSSDKQYAIRYMYMPMAGFSIMLASLVARAGRFKVQAAAVLCAVALVLGAMSYAATANWKDNVAFYKMAVRSNPAYIGGYVGIADHYQEAGRLDMAIKVYMGSIEQLHPEFLGTAYAKIAGLAGQSGLTLLSSEYYRKMLEVEPDSTTALAGLGSNLMLAGDFKGAIKYYERALMLDGKNYEAVYNLALSYEYMNDPKTAAYYYGLFVDAAPEKRYATALKRAREALGRQEAR